MKETIEVRDNFTQTIGTIEREVIEVDQGKYNAKLKVIDTHIKPHDREVVRLDRARRVNWIYIEIGCPLPPDMVKVDPRAVVR